MSDKCCKLCHRSAMRRINRRAAWEHSVMSRLGFYPWECVFCRKRQFFHDDGSGTHDLHTRTRGRRRRSNGERAIA